ncbi:response regulator receiver domain protein [Leptospira interrogans serovar Icterohaemorrhagiae str. Verdun HP]|uniref:Response regulator receiver domain protein n=1 Tax=Leptospira interrogans serovar Icterohaemorrhagiae str. Verdun HP TaxID=1049910 RepID=M6RCX1_LEPIR|nr:response regulator receiver domain protein [Leptospira interrogans serovar Icterohaemorrhagiae str. Verdun HP]
MTPMRILFLDDEEMIRDLFREIFGTIHDLTLIGSAEEALEVCKDKSFDLIITDVRLPKMSGIDFISRLRDKEINTPFIVITGNQDIEISIRALRLGAVDFFIKPFRMDAIRHSLQKFESLFISSQELISKKSFSIDSFQTKFCDQTQSQKPESIREFGHAFYFFNSWDSYGRYTFH